jgi:predicted phosphodiesterase
MSTTTTLVIPDTHMPYHDESAVRLVEKVVDVCQPDRVIFLGDWADNYACSQYLKDPAREFALKDELEIAGARLRAIVDRVPEFYFIEGNHELRFPKFIAAKAPELLSLTPTVREMWGIPEPRWIPYYRHITLGRVSYAHDIGHSGKGALRQSLDAFADSLVFGHTHLAGVVHDADTQGRGRFALNAGWLGDVRSIDYRHRATCRGWRQGFGWVVESEPTARRGGLAASTCTASFIPIENHAAIVEGCLVAIP